MVKVASMELSKELYELSGWKDTFFSHMLKPTRLNFAPPKKRGDTQESTGAEYKWEAGELLDTSSRWFPKEHFPAYDLGYLLRKFPEEIKLEGLHYIGDSESNIFWLEMERDGAGWAFYLSNGGESEFLPTPYPTTPEDAACMLAIALLKAGVLKK